MANELTQPRTSQLPDYLRDKMKTEKLGNIDKSDVVIPRIKLLQGTSPECEQYETAKSGQFWHAILNEPLGKELIGIPIVLRKTQVLWAPRNDDRGILARSRDAIHWEPPQGSFQVQFKGNPKIYTWRLAPTVAESGLDKFGSSRDDDPKSPPAASLTYELLWYFPERPDLGPSIILNSRGSVGTCQRLISMIEAKPVDHFYQLYAIQSVPDKGPSGEPFSNYRYVSLGYAGESDGEIASGMFKQYKDIAFRASDERDESGPPSGGNGGPSVQRDANTKF